MDDNTSRSMSVVSRGVQQHVCKEFKPGDMQWFQHVWCEQNPVGINTLFCCHFEQVRDGVVCHVHQPQHSFIDSFEDVHPTLEDLFADLDCLIEVAVHDKVVFDAF